MTEFDAEFLPGKEGMTHSQMFQKVEYGLPVKCELPAKQGGVKKSWAVTILIIERNPPERIFLTYIKIFSQEDFALRSKLWPNNFS